MIRKFSLENFYSFKRNCEVSFIVNKKAPRSEAYFTDNFKGRLTKLIAVLGANASGKTNLLKVLPFLRWVIASSFLLKSDEEIPIKPFVFGSSRKAPTKLVVEFEMDKLIFRYTLKINTKRFLSEELKVRKASNFKLLFSREWNKKDRKYSYDFRNYNVSKGFEKLVAHNASIIATAARAKHPLSTKIAHYWLKMQSNVKEEGRIPPEPVYDTAKFFQMNPELKKKADKLLAKFDLGLSKVKIIEHKTEPEKKTFYIPFGLHRTKPQGENYPLPFTYESGGTKNLFVLLGKILETLKEGGIAVLDELDADLHPHMIPALTDLFLSKVYNPKNAQLFFTTHQSEILQRLDKYQIVLVEKGKNGESECWRLDQIRGVRSDDNYYTKYLSGAYGALPDV